ncbi:MAG: glycosyltransferase family 2 protein [Lachnospiraceae bacterium]
MQKEDYQAGLVSIIVPFFNSALFLARTLNCIKNQTYRQWELILVDDASTDGSASLAEKWIEESSENVQQVCLLKNEQNMGPAFSRNRGIRAAHGRYLVYLDADDYWEVDKLEKQYHFMREKDCAFSFTGYEFAGKDGIRNGRVVHVPERITYEEALTNTTISTITVMFDRSRIPDELLFMPEHCQREDTATWWKILKNGYTAYGLDEALSVYCRHKGSHSSNKLKAVLGTYRMYREQEGLGGKKTMVCMLKYIYGAVKRRL